MKKRVLAMVMAISVCFTSVGLDTPLYVSASEVAETEDTESSTSETESQTEVTVDESENSENSESTESTEATESTESTEDTESTESTESTEATESTESTESTETEETEVTESTEDTESTESTEDTEATESTESTETEETEVTESTESTESTEEIEETETEETETEEAEDILLNYVMVESSYIETPDTQNIVVSVGEEDSGLEDVTLHYTNTTTGKTYKMAAAAQYEDFALFSMEFTGGSDAGVYELTSVSYTLDDQEYELTLADIDLEAKFGVDTEADADPDEVFYESDELADVEANVVTMDASGNIVSENTVEDVLNDGISLQSALKGASSNVVVVLDPGHDDTHAGAQANGVGEEDLVLKIATYCKEELEEYSGITVYMTRSSGTCPNGGSSVTAGTCNEKRVSYASSVGADVYVSFHLNSSSSTSANGVGIYYPNSNYNATAGQVGKALATKVYEKLTALGLSTWSTGIMIWNATYDTYDDGSTADYLGVIRNCKKAGIPAILIEHAFISGTSDYSNYLSSDSKLQALGVADATAIAEYYGLSKTSTTPTIQYTQSQTGGKLKIVWSTVDSASYYELWRSTSKSSGYSLVENVEDTNSYTDDSLTAGKKYYYKVRAVYSGGSTSDWSSVASGRVLAQAKITSVVSKSSKKLTITWKKVTGAEGYYIYRKSGSSYDKIATVTSGSTVKYVDSVSKNNTSYSYKVQAYNTNSGKTGVGSLSSAKSGKAVAKPTIKAVVSKDQTTLTIKWKKVSGASGYVLQRATSKSGTYTTIKTIDSGSTTSYDDSTVKKNKTYYYRIQAYNKVDGNKGYSGYSSVVSGKTLVKTKITSVVSKNETTLTVKWKKVSGASGYIIQRSTSKNGTYKTVKTIKSGSTVSYNDKKLKAGKKYYYKIQAYKGSGDNTGYSGYCSAVYGKTAKKTSITYVISSSSTKLKIGWKEIDDAYGYRIKRSTSKNGTYETIGSVTGSGKTSYTDKNLKAGKTYYYKIETINKVNGKKGYSGDSKAVAGTILKATTITKAQEKDSSTITLTWKKVTGADGYQVYRSTSKKGTYVKIATVKGQTTNKYTDDDLSGGKTYYYKVRAYQTSGTKTGTGSFSSILKAWTVKKPTITKVSGTADGEVTLTWDKVSKAVGYYIYRSTKSNSGFEKIATISSGSTVKYTDDSVKTGTKYYYKIAAISNITGSTMGRGDYSKTVTVPVLKAPTISSVAISSGTSAVIKWKSVDYATGYQLYYSTSSDGTYKKIMAEDATSYTHTNLGTGSNYYYKVRAYYSLDNGSTVYSAWSSVKKLTAGYAIMGASSLTVDEMVAYYESKNYTYPSDVYSSKGAETAEEFFTILKEEAEDEGVKTEVLFAQVMLETGGLQFGGDVQAEQCNFGGLGAVGGGAGGETFATVRIGLRAQTQHLKAYASTDALNNDCVDTRFSYVTRGCAPYVEWLSIPNNPSGKGWATDSAYATKLFAIMNSL